MARLLTFHIIPARKFIRVHVNRQKRLVENGKPKHTQVSIGAFRIYNDPYQTDEALPELRKQLSPKENIELTDFLASAKFASNIKNSNVFNTTKATIRIPTQLVEAMDRLCLLTQECGGYNEDTSIHKVALDAILQQLKKFDHDLSIEV
ncbi:MAG: hypothetical protein KAS93_07430 [Gammaproteobacteria bacterium]|nr:hypothetical protein [Gammaproteobacteria bacterium]